MIVSAIVAVSKNNVIGKEEDIPWYLPADLAFFKRTTLNHHVIMGRSTFQAIGRPLPKRTNIVLTRNPFFIASGVLTAKNISEALAIAVAHEETEVFICGGGKIYEQTMPLWDKLYLTEVGVEVEDGDTFFPPIHLEHWELLTAETHQADAKNEYDYTFKVYRRL
ncbi:MAG: dihydrofolate reductase [Saprospiraceae bacterium]|nr:dihydrofolate reductase [Saprospiraceae bacterium]